MVGIQPELWVERAGEALAFYQAAFGARVVHCVGEGDDIVAQLTVGDASFWVSAADASSGRFSPADLKGGTSRTLLVVDDPKTPSPVQAVSEVIAEGQRRGEIRADQPAESLAVVLCYSVLAADRRGATLGRPPDLPPLSELALDVVLRGMRPDDGDTAVARARHGREGTGRTRVGKEST